MSHLPASLSLSPSSAPNPRRPAAWRRVTAASLLAALGVFTACGGGSSATGGGAGAGAGTGTGGNSANSCPGDLVAAPDSAYCAKEAPAIDCALVAPGEKNQVCGVAVPAATTALTRSANVMEYAGSGPPDLSCFAPSGYPKAGTPQMVTVSGLAQIFAHGCASTGLDIEIHKVIRSSGADNGMIGDLVGTAFTTPASCTTSATGFAGPDPNMACGGTVYECKFTYPDVPTETELIFLTKGSAWTPLYEYNDYIPNSAVTGGMWTHNVRALSSDDYSAIAQTAIGATIPEGNGAIAGETHDCQNVRLGGATVGVNVQVKQLVYFTDDEADPLPDLTASSTSALGLFAALDIEPGPVTVGAVGLVDGKLTTVGWSQVQVYANAVTVATFAGPLPFQIQ